MKKIMKFMTAVLASLFIAVPTLSVNAATTGGTESEPADFQITKNFISAEGVETPADVFTFEFTPYSYNMNIGEVDKHPAITSTVSYDAAAPGNTVDGVVYRLKNTDDVLEGVAWTQPGIYAYVLSEKQESEFDSQHDLYDEKIEYSQNQYLITIYVKQGTSKLYVESLYIEGFEDGEDGEPGSGNGEKYEPNEPDEDDENETGADFGFVFENTFSQQIKEDLPPTDPEVRSAASITHTVDELGDVSKYFSYDVRIDQPAINTGTAVYKAYIIEGDDIVSDITSNYSGVNVGTDGTDEYVEITSGIQETINLKAGQEIVFANADAGSVFEGVSQATARYIPSVVVTEGGIAQNPVTADVNTSLSSGLVRIIGTGGNKAAFTLTLDTVTPTDVVVNNLPFIVIALIGVGALVLLVQDKKRRQSL